MNASKPSDAPQPTAAMEREAAARLASLDAGANPADRAAVDAWRAADPRHEAAWRRVSAASRALDRLQALRPDSARRNADPDLPLPRGAARVRQRRVRRALTASAAAFALTLGWFAFRPAPELRGPAEQILVSEVGRVQKHVLPDGSTLRLNTATEVAVAFDDRTRRLRLVRGEAHFEVAKDANRPFVVRTPTAVVRAVGTAFSVRLNAETLEVLVTEGSVGIAAPNAADASLLPPDPQTGRPRPALHAGNRAVVAADPNAAKPVATVSAVDEGELVRRLAWHEGRLEFAPTALENIVAEMNRYTMRRLVIDDPAVARLNIGGSFRTGDWETLVRLLEANFGVVAQSDGDVLRLRRK